jgi:hypothetical protein
MVFKSSLHRVEQREKDDSQKEQGQKEQGQKEQETTYPKGTQAPPFFFCNEGIGYGEEIVCLRL